MMNVLSFLNNENNQKEKKENGNGNGEVTVIFTS